MKLHTVVVSYNRPELLQETVSSYLATVTVPYTLVVVDNGSAQPTQDLLVQLEQQLDSCPFRVLRLGKNVYPGPACNIGFAGAPLDASHLHRSDNDMRYLPGWCEEVAKRFANPKVGQVGLRTDAEELSCFTNVGGTAVFRQLLWEQGLRYRQETWQQLGSCTEDYWISKDVTALGYLWRRVRKPCVVHIATGDMADPYYQQSYGIRGMQVD